MRRVSENVERLPFQGAVLDVHGNEVETWGLPVLLGVYAINPVSTSEVFIDGHQHRVQTRVVIYLPRTAVITDRDKIVVRGEEYRVDGEVSDYRNPYDASMNGRVVSLVKVAG